MGEHGEARGGESTSELLYRSLFEHHLHEVQVWRIVHGADGGIESCSLVDASPRTLARWGVELAEVLGLSMEEVLPDADAPERLRRVVEQSFETGEPVEWDIDAGGGQPALHMITAPVGDNFVSIGFDVSELMREQHDASDTLDRLYDVIRGGGVGLWDWDLSSDEVHFSDEWKAQLGYLPDEISDSFDEWERRCHPEDRPRALRKVEASLQSPRDNEYSVVMRMKHKNGSWRWIHARASMLRDEDGKPLRMLGSHIDVTEERRLAEHLREAQKLESLGTLAAGIAHDFNNILTAAMANVSIVLDRSDLDEDVRATLQAADSALGNAELLTNQLLALSKGGMPVRDVASIQSVILDSANFVVRGSRSTVEFAIADDLLNVEADVGQLSQVLSNLVINADQAMPAGGVITVSASNVAVAPGDDRGLSAGMYVALTVADEGPGIPEEMLHQIFDPFFTTKAAGSGLGLATSHAIASNHGGLLSVESAVGVGTTFEALIPATDREPRAAPTSRLHRGDGRVLVMDDDEQVLAVTVRMLERLGYVVEGVGHATAAVERHAKALEAGTPFDLVILDLTIPGMPGGDEVLAEMRRLRPDVVGIVTSGYADNDVLAQYSEYGFEGRLPKPFNLGGLSAEVERVLYSPGGR